MKNVGPSISHHGLEIHGISNAGTVYWNLPPARLYEEAVRRGEAHIAADGPLVAHTGVHTGRSPNDKFVVKEASSQDEIWWGNVNKPVEQAVFDKLLGQVLGYFQGRDLFVFDGYAGADPRHRINVRVINQNAWQNLFARNMFVREPDMTKLASHQPDFTVINAPGFLALPERDGTRTSTFILVDFAKKLVLIGGTEYAGEIKKSIFTVMNYLLPKRGVLSMHCSANYAYGRDGKPNPALFFGLSGTGKTTLSADPERTLIGDDEHGWSDDGIFNVEGGCYAKVIRLNAETEPEIYATTRRFGTVLENVAYDKEHHELDLNSDGLTENTRSSYPLEQLANVDLTGVTGHPKHVIFLTCDAFGVLPPISRLTPEQAMFHFLSGYTAKVAGTEKGVTEPSATFSACFGAPFLPLHPGVYAQQLGAKLAEHKAPVWLVNTGWTGGPHGVGTRMRLPLTRRMVSAALAGELDDVPTIEDPIFGVGIPQHVEGVPDEVLIPRNAWADPAAYDAQANKLANMFAENFKKYADGVTEAIRTAGPRNS
jgi:phosphoenolpyruvate carboxykinase (ATP)